MPIHCKRARCWAVALSLTDTRSPGREQSFIPAVTPGAVSIGKSWTDPTSVPPSHQTISCHDSQAITCVSGYLCRSLSPGWFRPGRLLRDSEESWLGKKKQASPWVYSERICNIFIISAARGKSCLLAIWGFFKQYFKRNVHLPYLWSSIPVCGGAR